MKNEKFFELLGNVDEKFIEEAITEYDPKAPVAVPAGKTRISPMKIIAPIAACLAVMIGAGIVVSNYGLTRSARPNSSISTSETSAPVVVKELADITFVNECKELVMSQLAKKDAYYKSLDASYISWDIGLLDMDFDGEDEYLIYPASDGVKGVFVFKNTQNKADYIGSFGEGVNIDFNKIYRAADGGDYYYYHYLDIRNISTNGYSCEGIWHVSLEQDRICETPGIYADIYLKYYCGREFVNALTCYDGSKNKISPDDFKALWEQYPYMPEPTITDHGISYYDIENAMELLAKKYGISDKSKLFKNECWFYKDINNDNIDEGIITFPNVPELPDIYVVGDNGTKFFGFLDITGKPFNQIWDGADRYMPPVFIRQGQDGDESFYYCTTTETTIVDGEEIETAWYIYKLVVEDDNTVWGEKHLNFGRDISNGGKVFLRLGNRDISASEFVAERNKFSKDSDYKFAEIDREMMMEAGLDFGAFYNDIKEIDPELRGLGSSKRTVRHRAALCSADLGDYRVSLCAENLFKSNTNSEPMYYYAEKLFITLADKDGKVIDIVDVKPQGSFFTETSKGFTTVIKKNIDDMFVAGEDNTTFELQFFTLDSAEKMSFPIENGKLVLNS